MGVGMDPKICAKPHGDGDINNWGGCARLLIGGCGWGVARGV
jgi:hypothetical protein